ncbi:hypothetical protein V6Z11_A02G000700 [Gossypium hirsutum]
MRNPRFSLAFLVFVIFEIRCFNGDSFQVSLFRTSAIHINPRYEHCWEGVFEGHAV